ncbi:MAG: nitrite reductase (NAD(P)H) small subunit [Terriglobia bacterium]
MSWIPITPLASIPLREDRCINVGDREIAIFNLGDRLAAIDAAFPHRGGPLCDGILTGTGAHSLTGGPLHGWKIDLATGCVLKPDVSVRVGPYGVRATDDGIVEAEMHAFCVREIAA